MRFAARLKSCPPKTERSLEARDDGEERGLRTNKRNARAQSGVTVLHGIVC